MSKYVFSDLDFTLLDSNSEISKENYNAIKDFEAKGNHFIISSGRVPFALKPFASVLDSKDIISANGCVIISDNKIIKKVLLSKDIVFTLTKYAIENKLSIRYFTVDHLLLLNKEYGSKQGYLYKQHIIVDEKNVFDEIEKCEIIKMVFTSDDPIFLKNVEKHINTLGLDIEISYSSSFFMEINAPGQNKGTGLIDYCRINNIDIKDTVSIGDNDNDLSMIETAGFSACPSNAIDEIKKRVDYICKNDHNHNAIKELLEKIK